MKNVMAKPHSGVVLTLSPHTHMHISLTAVYNFIKKSMFLTECHTLFIRLEKSVQRLYDKI